MTPADVELKAVAEQMGVGDTFRMTPVGVYFGDGPGSPRRIPTSAAVAPRVPGARSVASA